MHQALVLCMGMQFIVRLLLKIFLIDFSTFTNSLSTMIQFVFMDFSVINKMIEVSPINTLFLLFSFYYLVRINNFILTINERCTLFF